MRVAQATPCDDERNTAFAHSHFQFFCSCRNVYQLWLTPTPYRWVVNERVNEVGCACVRVCACVRECVCVCVGQGSIRKRTQTKTHLRGMRRRMCARRSGRRPVVYGGRPARIGCGACCSRGRMQSLVARSRSAGWGLLPASRKCKRCVYRCTVANWRRGQLQSDCGCGVRGVSHTVPSVVAGNPGIGPVALVVHVAALRWKNAGF